MDQLKNCPVCDTDSGAVYVVDRTFYTQFAVICEHCRSRTEYHYIREDAVKEWNEFDLGDYDVY